MLCRAADVKDEEPMHLELKALSPLAAAYLPDASSAGGSAAERSAPPLPPSPPPPLPSSPPPPLLDLSTAAVMPAFPGATGLTSAATLPFLPGASLTPEPAAASTAPQNSAVPRTAAKAESLMDHAQKSIYGTFMKALDETDLKKLPLDLPSIVVIGNQSVGKSSLLENILKCSLFPAD